MDQFLQQSWNWSQPILFHDRISFKVDCANLFSIFQVFEAFSTHPKSKSLHFWSIFEAWGAAWCSGLHHCMLLRRSAVQIPPGPIDFFSSQVPLIWRWAQSILRIEEMESQIWLNDFIWMFVLKTVCRTLCLRKNFKLNF